MMQVLRREWDLLACGLWMIIGHKLKMNTVQGEQKVHEYASLGGQSDNTNWFWEALSLL